MLEDHSESHTASVKRQNLWSLHGYIHICCHLPLQKGEGKRMERRDFEVQGKVFSTETWQAFLIWKKGKKKRYIFFKTSSCQKTWASYSYCTGAQTQQWLQLSKWSFKTVLKDLGSKITTLEEKGPGFVYCSRSKWQSGVHFHQAKHHSSRALPIPAPAVPRAKPRCWWRHHLRAPAKPVPRNIAIIQQYGQSWDHVETCALTLRGSDGAAGVWPVWMYMYAHTYEALTLRVTVLTNTQKYCHS